MSTQYVKTAVVFFSTEVTERNMALFVGKILSEFKYVAYYQSVMLISTAVPLYVSIFNLTYLVKYFELSLWLCIKISIVQWLRRLTLIVHGLDSAGTIRHCNGVRKDIQPELPVHPKNSALYAEL